MQVVLIYLLLMSMSEGIEVIISRSNIGISSHQWQLYEISLEKSNAQLIPSTIQIDYEIQNSQSNLGDYFDYFYYLTETDYQCYKQSTNNGSYLFPCSFLSNDYSILRTSHVDRQFSRTQYKLQQLQNSKYFFLLDNTPFPYPDGAYPYTEINLNLKEVISIQLSNTYQALGVRLIYLNVTAILIFSTFILYFWRKEVLLRKKMCEKETPANMREIDETRNSNLDQQNYMQIINNPFQQSSLISSKKSSDDSSIKEKLM